MRFTRLSIRGNPRRGMIAVQSALCMTVLLSVMAIAVDGGVLLAQRRFTQTAADLAAMAAATDLYTNYPTNNGQDKAGTAKQSALATALAQGFANDGVSSTVTVNIPPLSGNFAGRKDGYVEVIVQYNQTRGFSALFGNDPIPVSARAVARGQWVSAPAIQVMDLSSSGAITIADGIGNITVKQGDVIDNSSSPFSAIDATAGNLSAPGFLMSGHELAPLGRFLGPTSFNQAASPDPLQFIPVPDPSSLSPETKGKADNNGVYHLQPGLYQGGLTFAGRDSVVMAPGVYYMANGGFSMGGTGNLSGSGVMIYNAPNNPSQGITIFNTGNVTLSAPTSGAYQGLLLFQDRNSTAVVTVANTAANGVLNFTGALYAANALIVLGRGPQDVALGSQYISRTLSLTGVGNYTLSGSGANTRKLQLVE